MCEYVYVYIIIIYKFMYICVYICIYIHIDICIDIFGYLEVDPSIPIHAKYWRGRSPYIEFWLLDARAESTGVFGQQSC